MAKEIDAESTIEKFLTVELLDLEIEKFSSTGLIPRSSYQQFYSSFSDLKNNLTKLNIITVLIKAIKENAQFINKDFNLYPILYKKLQECSIEINDVRRSTLSHTFDRAPLPTNTKHLYKQSLQSSDTDEYRSIFGSYFLIESTDLRWLSTVGFIANRILPPSMETFSLPTVNNQNNQIPIQSILSIIGPSMFLGSFYPPSSDSFDFRIDFLMAIIDAVESNLAASSFYDVISYHLKLITDSFKAIIIDLTIPNMITTVNDSKSKAAPSKGAPSNAAPTKPSVKIERNSLWTYTDWRNGELNPREIVSKLADIYINSTAGNLNSIPFITVQVLVPTRTHNTDDTVAKDGYHKIRICYVPHTLQIKDSSAKQEIWSSFGNRENEYMHHMFEGLFLKEAHAVAFMTLVLHQALSVTNGTGSGNIELNRSKRLVSTSPANQTSSVKEVRGLFGIFKFPDLSPTVLQNEETVNSPANLESDIWRNNLSVTENIWAKAIAKSNVIKDFFPMLGNIVKLIVAKSFLRSNNFVVEILEKEVKTILNSSTYQLYDVIQVNIMLRELIYCYNEHGRIDVIMNMFLEYINKLTHILNRISSQHNVSLASSVAQRIISRSKGLGRSRDIIKQRNEFINPQIMLELRYFNNLCYPLLWQMVGDSLLRCPNIQRLISTVVSQFPGDSHRAEVLVDGVEFSKEMDFLKFFQSKNVDPSASSQMDIIAYLRLIEFNVYWKEFLVTVLERKEYYDPNDLFVLLSQLFNGASSKFDVGITKSSIGDYSSYQSECVDPTYYLYKSLTYEVYGRISAIMLFDYTEFQKFAAIFASMDHIIYDKSVALYEVAISTGLIGQLPYYGSVDLFVRSMDIVDNIYVTGPENCLQEGTQIFARAVIKHVLSIHESTALENWLVIGLFMPANNQVWSIDHIRQNEHQAMIEIARFVRQWGAVNARILVPFQWRYLTLHKHFQFHFNNFQRTQYFSSMTDDHLSIESFGLVFFNRESAQTYFKMASNLKIMDDPFSPNNLSRANQIIDEIITDSYHNQSWIRLYRALVTKSTINGNYEFVDESSKMFNGTLGHFDLLNSLNKTIQNVIFHIMASKLFSCESSVDSILVPAPAPVTPAKKSKTKSNVTPSTTPKLSSSDILNTTFRGYYLMVTKLLENPNMEHIHLKTVLLPLLNEIANSNGQKGIVILANDESIKQLEQIRQIMESVESSYGYISRRYCPKSLSYIESMTSRPPKISVPMVESSEGHGGKVLTLEMIKSDGYQHWSTEPDYGWNF